MKGYRRKSRRFNVTTIVDWSLIPEKRDGIIHVPGKDSEYPIDNVFTQIETQQCVDDVMVDAIEKKAVKVAGISFRTLSNTTVESTLGYHLEKKPGPADQHWDFNIGFDLGFSMPAGYSDGQMVRGVGSLTIEIDVNVDQNGIRAIPLDQKFYHEVVLDGITTLAETYLFAWPIQGDHPYATRQKLLKRVLFRYAGTILAGVIPKLTYSTNFWFEADDAFPTVKPLDFRPRVRGNVIWNCSEFGIGSPVYSLEGESEDHSSSDEDFEVV